MRKPLLWIALLFGCAIFFACNNNTSTPAANGANAEDSLKKVIAKGEYLARHVAGCIDCHSTRDLTKFSAPVVPGTEGGGGFAFVAGYGIPGTLYGKNITPDPETGIGSWSDDEVLRAMTQGIRKNGDSLFPIMPYVEFNHMAKEDLLSIIAYIRTLKPIKNKVPDRQLMLPMHMAYPAGALQPSIENNKKPDPSNLVAYGEYLTTMASCSHCHTPVGPKGLDMSRRFQGGHMFDNGIFKVVSANITPDSATGIGTWTEERFLTKFTQYRDPSSWDHKVESQNTLMPLSEMAGMTDQDLKAIYAYLRTLKPATNAVEKFPK